MLGGIWQLDAEAAFNRLDQSSQLFNLDASGDYVELPFPSGSGDVTEVRYEVILTHGRTLVEDLTIQLGGGEYSELAQTGPGGLTRRYLHPRVLPRLPGSQKKISMSHSSSAASSASCPSVTFSPAYSSTRTMPMRGMSNSSRRRVGKPILRSKKASVSGAPARSSYTPLAR
jgi:hypothetical protein